MDPVEVLDCLAIAAARATAADAAAVLLPDERGDSWRVAAACGVPAWVGTRLAVSWPAEWPLAVADANPSATLPPGFAASLCVPLGSPDQPSGVVCVYSASPRRFELQEGRRLQAVADLGAAALRAVRQLADLERVETGKAQFIRVATHELRAPVTVTQSLVRTVLKGYAGPLSEQQRDIFSRIAGRLDFLESLVNDLLDLAAGKAPELAEAAGPVVVNASVGRATLLLQPGAEEKDVALTFRSCRDKLAVWATEEGLDRVFVNLIGNAVKYTPAGGSVTVSMCRVDGEVQVAIADTGIGIPEESLPHLFDEFYRAPNARSFSAGTGLGLAIVKDLVERYGGRIAVESIEGQGTTVTVAFEDLAGLAAPYLPLN